MLRDFPDTFIAFQIHINDPYATPWGDDRKEFYGVEGTPTAWFDGSLGCAGAYPTVSEQYDWYESQYLARRAVPTDVTIELRGEWIEDRSYEVTATVCREGGGDPAPRPMRVHIVQVLDHWPEAGDDNRNGFRQGAPPKIVSLVPGECRQVKGGFPLDDESWGARTEIRFVAWAQDPADSGPAEVYQAAVLAWPLPSCRRGTVDLAASGDPAQVLTINGGTGEAHRVAVAAGDPVVVAMDASPSGPSPGRFALYVWAGAPSLATVTPLPWNLGSACLPMPLAGGTPAPRHVWNNIGKESRLGEPDLPSTPAPSIVFERPGGIPFPVTATFQGILLDDGSAAGVPASVTDAVILQVE